MEYGENGKLNIEDVKYIMVTDRDNHWDKLAVDNQGRVKAHFPQRDIYDGIFRDSLNKKEPTLFIKRTSDGKQIENCWIGTALIFARNPGTGIMHFNVENLEEIACPEAYVSYSIGCHYKKETIFTSKELQNIFINQLGAGNWKTFEDGCYNLLNYIGISCIAAVPRDNNRGKEDGAFLIRNLAVLYDCTLDDDFLDKKRRQIKNYIQELKTGEIQVGSSIYPLKRRHRKQVWIITRSESSSKLETNLFIKDGAGVIVKEVPYQQLVTIFQKKLAENLNEEGIYKLLLKI